MQLTFDVKSADSYRQFLSVRKCPSYRFTGRSVDVPDQYAHMIENVQAGPVNDFCYTPHLPGLFDYQRDISAIAIRRRKYAVFAECGLGKTLILLEFAKSAAQDTGGKILIVSPLMVCRQTIAEAGEWYGGSLPIKRIAAADLQPWLDSDGCEIGITNYEAIRDGLTRGNLKGLILDESSMLKSAYGKWGLRLIEMGRGLDWKLCLTGTPAPNDRIEFANHAVFLDRCRTVNEFLASYFINRGQTSNRWELKPHALKPFYRFLSDWSIFVSDPAVYGWKDNVGVTPPIHVHIDHIDLTDEQRAAAQQLTGNLIASNNVGGIGQRSKLSQIAKGKNGMPTLKPEFIRKQIESWPDESTIIWCQFNPEQSHLAKTIPNSVNVTGDTKEAAREAAIDAFQSGEARVLITKPKILGFGLNLQIATRQIFSGIDDSYEKFHQAVKRSNRVGSTKPLNVHIPVTELEHPFIENVLRKAGRVATDTEQQEALFKEFRHDAMNF